jgi:hypothetical protein
MKKALCIITSLWPMLGLAAQLTNATSRLEARIVDDLTGQPLAARVAITNAEGKFIEIEGEHSHVLYLEKRWCYVDGTFALGIPDSGAGIEIRRGLETRPLSATIAGGASGNRVFRLRRWSDVHQKGYVNGDIHAHLPVPKEAHAQMRAEDLNALTLLHLAIPEFHSPVNECFAGKVDTNSTPGCEVFVSQEVQDFQMGHLTLLNLTNLVSGYPNFGGGMEYWQIHPHWDLGRAMRATRAQNGMVVWSHICSLPGAQLPVGIALGLVDGVELITWNDPTQFPNHFGPWQNSGMSQAEFPVMRSMDLYYQFLNAGFRLPIAAGTDKFGEEIPLGSNRTFAHVKEPANYGAWLAAVKAGRTFVSNGPLLEFAADGHEAGDVVDFQGSKQVQAKVTARSILPFTTLEIVLNGETIGHKTMPVYSNAPVDGVYSMEIQTAAQLTRSGWLAARVVDHPDLKNPILPRRLSVFAHTSPIYFRRDGHPVREEPSIIYLRKYVQGFLHWLATNPPFFNESDRLNAKRDAQEALRIYQAL